MAVMNHFTVEHVTTGEVSQIARELRGEVYTERLGVDPRAWSGDSRRDREGYLMLLREHGVPVATGRVLATRSAHSELRELAQVSAELMDSGDVCEVGRLAARSAHARTPYGAILLCLGAGWLLENTHFTRYVAYCRDKLVPLYRKFGASVLDVKFAIPSRGSDQYSVVLGDIAHSAELAAALTGGIPPPRRV